MTDLQQKLGAERLAELRSIMKADSRPAIGIRVGERAAETPGACAIGGPAWRPDETVGWPKDNRGVVMMHLARINFAEVPALAGYPDRGILQIFISTDDIEFGAYSDHGTGYLVEWWPEPGEGIAVAQPFLDEENFESTPLLGGSEDDGGLVHDDGRSLSFEPFDMAATPDHPDVVRALGEWLDADNESRELYSAKLDLEAFDYEVWIGGHPFSVQQSDVEEDEVVLLQLGTGSSDDFMWGGDWGAATFSISRDALEARDFGKTSYSAGGH